MVTIVAAGAAYPKQRITNQFLAELRPDLDVEQLELEIGIHERATVLPLDFIRDTKNSDPWESVEVMTESPTDLAFRAVEHALHVANLEADQIGMIIGENCTPFETTPSEAQRVGQRFGLKVPAYDAFSGSGALPFQLDLISRWDIERLPEYILCVSANTPTQRVDYRSGYEAAYFGDSAAAFIVSVRGGVGLKVQASQHRVQASQPDLMKFDLYESASIDHDAVRAIASTQFSDLVTAALQDSGVPQSSACLLTAACNPVGVQQVLKEQGHNFAEHWSQSSNYGYSLGSGAMATLASHWDAACATKAIVSVTAAGSVGSGYVVMAPTRGDA